MKDSADNGSTNVRYPVKERARYLFYAKVVKQNQTMQTNCRGRRGGRELVRGRETTTSGHLDQNQISHSKLVFEC